MDEIDTNTTAPNESHGAMVVDRAGQIEFAGADARACLAHFFAPTSSPSELPTALAQWLQSESFREHNFHLVKGQHRISVALHDPDEGQSRCLLLWFVEAETNAARGNGHAGPTPHEVEILSAIVNGIRNWHSAGC